MGFPDGSMVKNLPVNAGDARDMASIPVSGRSSGEVNGNWLQYCCLESHGTLWAIGHKEWDATDQLSTRV